MKYQQKNNSGSLFLNDRKTKENHPDYKGKAVINGQTIYMSAWVKVANNGNKFMSLSFQSANSQPTIKYEPAETIYEEPKPQGTEVNFSNMAEQMIQNKPTIDDEEIPF